MALVGTTQEVNRTIRHYVERRSGDVLWLNRVDLDALRMGTIRAVGGVLIHPEHPAPKGVKVLHLWPHAGLDIDDDLARLIEPSRLTDLPALVYRNYDRGTPSLFGPILDRASATRDSALACFLVTRVFADPNREGLDCVPSRLYRGVSPLNNLLDDAAKQALIERLIAPWVE